MSILYFDCICGISGDMTISALLDLGVDKEFFLRELKKLHLPCEFEIGKTIKNGISANTFAVLEKEHPHHHHHTGLHDILALIHKSTISQNAKELAIKIFTLLANAEAKVHNTTVDEIHFHEVGAVDSIADIVGVSIIMDMLKPQQIFCCPLVENSGTAYCEHGAIPVPVPAVVEILRLSNVPLQILSDPLGESITPTGAAIICTLANHFGGCPPMQMKKIGYGAGKKEFKKTNVLRILLGEGDIAPSEILEISTNIDDMSPEALSFVSEILFENNALDVFFTPIYMKKNRPAYMLSLLCKESDKECLISIILSQTTAAGLRIKPCDRVVMHRESLSVKTKYGDVLVKKLTLNAIEKVSPEYESVKEIAKKSNVSFIKVYDEAKKL